MKSGANQLLLNAMPMLKGRNAVVKFCFAATLTSASIANAK